MKPTKEMAFLTFSLFKMKAHIFEQNILLVECILNIYGLKGIYQFLYKNILKNSNLKGSLCVYHFPVKIVKIHHIRNEYCFEIEFLSISIMQHLCWMFF